MEATLTGLVYLLITEKNKKNTTAVVFSGRKVKKGE